ncbi:MAG TPA: diguanylate cyclase, partial [Gammaproteobacteria bacterium]|nr:diguanylate cyclase [Gammaproteobacteria bacterium]
MPRPRLSQPARRALSSLPGRYLLGALLLLGVLVASAWVVSAYMEAASTTRSAHLQQRQQALRQLQGIRGALWRAEHNLLAYSLTPAPHFRNQAMDAISEGRRDARALAQMRWSRRSGQSERARRVARGFDHLERAAGKLITIRNDPVRLYPALELMRSPLGPTSRRFLENAQQALSALAGEDTPAARRARSLFSRARYYWSRMVGEFRLYMTARVGLLGGTQDQSRRANLRSFHAALGDVLDRLEALDGEPGLGLSASQALDRMRALRQTWFDAFLEVEELYANRNWRADFPLITDTLYPLYEGIHADLRRINHGLETSTRAEMATLSRAARRIALLPWALVGLHIVVVTAGFLYLRRRVLTPLSGLARALHREAEGKAAALTLTGGPTELQDLSAAFRRMRREVRSRQGALEHQAFHDALTGLPNRALLEDRLEQAILRSHRSGTGGALMMLDLDFFKEINDTFGHPAGDSVLQLVAERLRQEVRASDTVARFGGDEFGLLLPGLDRDQAGETADRLLAGLRPQLRVGDHSFHVSGSIGMVLFPDHGEDAETLIRRADMAMYQAKDKRQGWALFQPHQDTGAPQQVTRRAELYDDVQADRVPLHFQSQWDLADNRLTGGEALLRWAPPGAESLPPPEVLVMAQRAGILQLLTRRIVNTAMREAAGWTGSPERWRLALNLT